MSLTAFSHDHRHKLESQVESAKSVRHRLRLWPKRCPYCGSLNVRRSHFQSQDESEERVFTSPYRCGECLRRFFVLSRKTRYYATIVILAFLLVLAIVSLIPMRTPLPVIPAEHSAAAEPRE